MMGASPQIKATFLLGPDGRPEQIEQGDLKHFKIKLQVDGAPEDTYAVTYLLDSSYHTPVREALNRTNGFSEELTSYGDYNVEAKIRTRDGVYAVSSPLSAALEAGHAAALTPPITAALNELKVK